MGKQGRKQVNAIPEVLKAKVLVGGMLVVVVICDWKDDERRRQNIVQ
jgi:hypothetical protein